MIVFASLAALAFGGLGAAIALYTGQASVVQGLFPLVFVILFLSDAFFPVNLILEPAATIAEYNPLSFIVEGIRDPVIGALDARRRCSRRFGAHRARRRDLVRAQRPRPAPPAAGGLAMRSEAMQSRAADEAPG